ncbi:3-oxoacyl-ACP reductase [Solicola sp. PLA-1-18]|uniref:3-oxoacyl-ACP reductase n=1 Tax=Solicola sp. PLA-1-18 TaxID=3380532 RepID=UPI003B79D411
MSDRYQALAHSTIGRLVVKNLGLPDPPTLDRWAPGSPVVDGTVLVGAAPGSTLGDKLVHALGELGVTTATTRLDGERYKALVLDATGIDTTAGLAAIPEFFQPVLRSLRSSARVLVVGTPPAEADDDARAIAQRSLEGLTRSLGKEIGGGSTVNLVYVADGAHDALRSTLEFLLSPKSAYVSGQVVRVGTAGVTEAATVDDALTPLAGKVALVTGASRGLGLAMARTLHRDGAHVIGLDIPQLAGELQTQMAEIDGDTIALDITAKDAPQRIARHVSTKTFTKKHGAGLDVLVHNAGVTRDKRLRNMKTDIWDSVIDINIGAPQRITAELLDQDLLKPNASVIGVSSIAGIAGNNGQTSYATSKAAVIGFVDELAPRVAGKGIRVNAVAPGFIETDMVKTIPFAIREAGRRMNSMAQGGQPVDVAEAVAWYANPGSSAVSGNVVRVCGQSLLGA